MKQNGLMLVISLAASALLLVQLGGCEAESVDSDETRSTDVGADSDADGDEAGSSDNAETGSAEAGETESATDRVFTPVDWRETAVHMRLLDDLDRPQDGWCLDVVGSGPHIRFDMPLIAHNCKPGLFADEAVEFTEGGQIRFPAYPGYCVTVMGLNQYALPGAALMLKGCGEEIPFLNAPQFQIFELLDNGMIRLKGSDLCITVGDVSERTFDPTHAWRTLFMERCDECDLSRSTWKFVRP